MSNGLLQFILALVGGLLGAIIGAVIGGYLSYKGAVDAAKKQIDFQNIQERKNRTYQEEQQKGIMKDALLVEIEENLKLAQSLASGDDINPLAKAAWDIYKGKSILTSEAWDIYKGNITKLSVPLQKNLLNVYIEVRKYNSLIEYERRKIPYGDVQLNPLIEEQAGKVVNACEDCKLAIKELPKD